MPIEASELRKRTRPARDEKVFDKWWLESLSVETPSATKGTLIAILYPMSADGEVDKTMEPSKVDIEDLWPLLIADPDLSAGMQSVLDRLGAYGRRTGQL